MRTSQFLGCVAIASAVAIAPAIAGPSSGSATNGSAAGDIAKAHPTATVTTPTATVARPTASSVFQPQVDPLGPKVTPVSSTHPAAAGAVKPHTWRVIPPPPRSTTSQNSTTSGVNTWGPIDPKVKPAPTVTANDPAQQ